VFRENVTMQETVTLNTQDQQRVLVVNQILEGHLRTAEAAALLNQSKRQGQRLVAAYRKEGVEYTGSRYLQEDAFIALFHRVGT
jgi:hypothetical protein